MIVNCPINIVRFQNALQLDDHEYAAAEVTTGSRMQADTRRGWCPPYLDSYWATAPPTLDNPLVDMGTTRRPSCQAAVASSGGAAARL